MIINIFGNYHQKLKWSQKQGIEVEEMTVPHTVRRVDKRVFC